jgi:hypothetical protein
VSDFPIPKGMTFSESGGVVTATSLLQTVTSGNADAFGGWSERITSTNQEADGFLLLIELNDTTMNEIAVNVGIGGAGNEEIIVDSINGQIKADLPGLVFWIPVSIPQGSRVSVQAATDGVNIDVGVALYLYSASFGSPQGRAGTIAYGMDGTEISEGTTVDPGGTANTKGAYAELESSTSDDITEFIICFGTADNVAHTSCKWLLDIAIGGPGVEEIILPDILVAQHAQEPTKISIPVPQGIPAGTRIAVRSQCTITDAVDRILTVSLNGVL